MTADLWTKMPPAARKVLVDTAEAIRAGTHTAGHEVVESDTDRAARLTAATAHRRAAWDRTLPRRFTAATLADLTDEPGLADGRVAKWLDHGSRVLVLHSREPGCGKTHTMYALGNTAVAGGRWAAAWTMADLNAALRPTEGDPAAYTAAVGCDLLGIDDLGREKPSEWTLEQLHRVLDDRMRNNRRVIVTTNLTGADLITRYGDPIVDRIIDGATVVEYTGPSRRRPAPW